MALPQFHRGLQAKYRVTEILGQGRGKIGEPVCLGYRDRQKKHCQREKVAFESHYDELHL